MAAVDSACLGLHSRPGVATTWLILLILLTGAGGCLSAAYAMGYHSENASLVRRKQGQVVVRGHVLDEQGHPINDVQVRFFRVYLTAGFDVGPDSHADEGTKKVSSTFELSWDPATSVTLTFEKKGYFASELFVAAGENAEAREQPGALIAPVRSVVMTLHSEAVDGHPRAAATVTPLAALARMSQSTGMLSGGPGQVSH